MKTLLWLLALAAIGAAGYMLWKWLARWRDRQRVFEDRFTSFIAEVKPPAPAAPGPAPMAAASSVPLQKLLLEAAAKAGEAGEAVISIQLYARLIARYPDSAFAAQARAAVEAQKKKLVKP